MGSSNAGNRRRALRMPAAVARRTILVAGLLMPAFMTGLPAPAQTPTTVQLPTYSYFGADTSVLAPDRGGVLLGSLNRAAAGRSEFGAPLLPWKQRAIGRATGASGTSVHVYVHDFEALEAELLGRRPSDEASPDGRPSAARAAGTGRVPAAPAVAAEALPSRATPAAATGASARASSPPKEPPLPSVAEIRAQRERRRRVRAEEAQAFYQRGLLAEESGSRGAARVYYQMAASCAEGELKSQIEAAAARLAASQRKNVATAGAP
jgi:hypothetical protein